MLGNLAPRHCLARYREARARLGNRKIGAVTLNRLRFRRGK
jgi:hypothetical protein